MKKRRLKKGPIIVILLISIMISVVLFLICKPKDKTNKNSNTNKNNQQTQVLEPKEKRMSIVMVGDALIHGAVYLDARTYQKDSNGYDTYDFSDMFTYIKPIIQKYDLRYYNQESIIGGKNLGISHYPLLNSPDEIGDDLVDIGFNMVSLANNHSLDKGTTGLLYSVDYWKSKDVITSGMFNSKEDRDNVQVYEQNGIKYSFLAYTTVTNGLTPKEDYYLNIYDEELVKKDVELARQRGAEVVIVSMHWGEEYTHTPVQEEYDIAEYLSSIGVNLVIGSHPHVIQPIAYVGDTLVIYSLGNFIAAQHPLGIEKTIGLLVGTDIVVKDGKVTFENLNYQLLYTYCTSNYQNFSVMPFNELDNSILNNYEQINQQYLSIVGREGL